MDLKMNSRRREIVRQLAEQGLSGVATRQEILTASEKAGIPFPQWLKVANVGYGKYNFGAVMDVAGIVVSDDNAETALPEDNNIKIEEVESDEITSPVVTKQAKGVTKLENDVSYIPERFEGYVPFGHFADVRTIISSKMFYPIYVTGLSGNGKTIMIEEICAREKRELIRTNITGETDEDDLIGGFRLIKGETVWQDGPIVTAMKRGAVVLLDEVDLGTPKLMCLQPVLEGKSIYIKKINQVVHPQPGFNVIATANTKGKGGDDGQFIGTMVMNEAFLERFAITMEQDYPSVDTEAKILTKIMAKGGLSDEADFIECLTKWAEAIRSQYQSGEITDIITTRRLVHICNAYVIFGQKREKALELSLNRFPEETKKTFLEFYSKIDAKIQKERAEEERKKKLEEERLRREKELAENPQAASNATSGSSSSPDQFPW